MTNNFLFYNSLLPKIIQKIHKSVITNFNNVSILNEFRRVGRVRDGCGLMVLVAKSMPRLI